MGFHTFDPERRERLRDPTRFRYCSREELVAALDPDPSDVVADLGSGTGFYTDEVAPFVEHVLAVDLQPVMHGGYRAAGVPDNVQLVTADVEALPFARNALDGAVSTVTFHEFASPDALAAVRRALVPGGRLAIVDWSARGAGDDGAPLAERFDVDGASDLLADAGFVVEVASERPETFLVVAQVPS